MPHEDSRLPKDWFKVGRADLDAVEILLDHGGNKGIAAMHIHQTVEKFLKGYLLARGWELKRTHDLVELLDAAVERNPRFEKFRALCQRVTPYYFEMRYPLFTDAPKKGEIRNALKMVKDLIALIEKDVK